MKPVVIINSVLVVMTMIFILFVMYDLFKYMRIILDST